MEYVKDEEVLQVFRSAGTAGMPTTRLFDALPAHAHADVVRTLERLEHDRGLLIRFSSDGADEVSLTARGAEMLGLAAPMVAATATVGGAADARWQRITDIETAYRSPSGREYAVSVEGLPRDDGTWAGRLRFVGGGDIRLTSQETSQPSRDALLNWAS